MNEWPAAIWASISAMTAALVLSFIVVLGSFARESAAIQHQEDNAIAIIKEYRQYSHYARDENVYDLYPQDVISAIAESRGNPEIWVDTLAGTGENFKKWTTATIAEEFGTTYLLGLNEPTDIFTPLARFNSKLEPDANGSIYRIEFRRQ